MKKRSLLAAASLAAGVALSLTAPHAHATGDTTGLVGTSGSEAVTGTEAVMDVLPVGDAETVFGTGTAALTTG
ncbi:hypothetical protein [Kitasatospora sp. P5_F3]